MFFISRKLSTRRDLWKKLLLKIFQNEHNICDGFQFTFSVKLSAYVKRRLYYRCFPVSFVKLFRTATLPNICNCLLLISLKLFKILPKNQDAYHCTKNGVFHDGFLQYMWTNQQKTADLVTFTEKVLNGKLQLLCSIFRTLPSIPNKAFFAKICSFLAVDHFRKKKKLDQRYLTESWTCLCI